jgi:hypothetical protein
MTTRDSREPTQSANCFGLQSHSGDRLHGDFRARYDGDAPLLRGHHRPCAATRAVAELAGVSARRQHAGAGVAKPDRFRCADAGRQRRAAARVQGFRGRRRCLRRRTGAAGRRAGLAANGPVLRASHAVLSRSRWKFVGGVCGDLGTASLRAKRSNPWRHKESMDCFVASLLAMTIAINHARKNLPSRKNANVCAIAVALPGRNGCAVGTTIWSAIPSSLVFATDTLPSCGLGRKIADNG